MTQFDLSPGFVKLRYDDTHRTHFQTLQVDPSGATPVGVEPEFVIKGGGTAGMEACIDLYVTAIQPAFAEATTIVSAEFWSKPLPSSDPVWVYTYAINLPGTSGAGVETFTRMVTRSFRTGAGHIMRNVLVGVTSLYVNDARAPIHPADAIGVFLLGSTSFILGRDNSFAYAGLNQTVKTNDALRLLELL